MSSSKQIINLFPIKQGENVFSSWMNEIFINIIHHIIDNQIPNSNFFIILEILDLIVYIIQYLCMQCMIFGLMFQRKFSHQTSRLKSIYEFKYYIHKDQGSENKHP